MSDDANVANDTNGNGQTAGQDGTVNNGTVNNTSENTATNSAATPIETELTETKQKLEEMTNIARQALADLQNYRRRMEEDARSTIVYANADLLKHLLPAIENLNRSLAHEPKDANWIQGETQSLKQFMQLLEQKNFKTIPTVGEKFDPRRHEALLTGPGEMDVVTEELEKGYLLGDKVLKMARVKVGNGETASG